MNLAAGDRRVRFNPSSKIAARPVGIGVSGNGLGLSLGLATISQNFGEIMTAGRGRANARTRVIATILALGLVPISTLAGGTSPAPAVAVPMLRVVDITWDQVAAAQADVDATAKLVATIKSQLAGLQAAVDATQADADAKGIAYGKAQDALDVQQFKVDTLQAQVDAAQAKADTAKKTSNQLLAAIARTGGTGLDMTTTLMTSSNPGATLAKLSTYGQVTGRATQIIAQALAAQKSLDALTQTANAAKAILAKDKDIAQAAFQTALVASEAAQTALATQQAAEAQLEAKLAVLTEHRNATLADYNATLLAKWGPGAAGIVSASGWANPVQGHLGDRFGMRFHPIYHVWKLHSGQDITGTGCGTNIYAAHSGTVIFAGPNGDLGNFIELDNGGGIITGYAHIIAGGILVKIGQHVGPGQVIAKVGSTGGSTGCHLHFIVRINGALTDPLPFMQARGVNLG
jgi:murein DD-endopeptidase MepM/ murein hydrolase activator NlpD